MTSKYPYNFPPKNIGQEHIVPLIGRANASLSRYDGLLESLINPEVLLSPLAMKEAELSSKIEGTVATANEAYEQQAGKSFTPEKSADIQEILNYRATLRLSAGINNENPFSLHLLREMHARLMTGVRGQEKPGQFRNTQNWIGKRGASIEQATYVPPSPLLLNELLDGFIEFINTHDDSLDPIVQAALMHAQFELIHPFDDGNGRIGRILIPLFLAKRGSLVSPSLYISGYLESNRSAYYEHLENISKEGDWLGWITFFLGAVIEQSKRNIALVREINDLYDQKKHEISALLRSNKSGDILDMLFDTPYFFGAQLHKRLDIQRPRAATYIQKLIREKIIIERRPSSGRRSALLAFADLLEITDRQ
jgi:Fic family protein